MTTLTADPAGPVSTGPASTGPASTGPISTAPVSTGPLTSRVSISQAVQHTLSFAWRGLVKMRRNPEQLVDVTLQPLLFTAMFAFIFGGAIAGDVTSYLPMIIPGILAQTVLTTSMATGVQLREDMDTGVFDRFKSLPIARVAPLAGPMVADLVRYCIATVLTLVVGFAMGYRPGGGVVGVAAAALLVIASGWALAWIFTFIGTVAKTARSVQGLSMMIMFPLTFLSNAFVPIDSLPAWLGGFVKINPVTLMITAVRDLANTGTFSSYVAWTLIACAVVVVIFAPLSVWSYTRKM